MKLSTLHKSSRRRKQICSWLWPLSVCSKRIGCSPYTLMLHVHLYLSIDDSEGSKSTCRSLEGRCRRFAVSKWSCLCVAFYMCFKSNMDFVFRSCVCLMRQQKPCLRASSHSVRGLSLRTDNFVDCNKLEKNLTYCSVPLSQPAIFLTPPSGRIGVIQKFENHPPHPQPPTPAAPTFHVRIQSCLRQDARDWEV